MNKTYNDEADGPSVNIPSELPWCTPFFGTSLLAFFVALFFGKTILLSRVKYGWDKAFL